MADYVVRRIQPQQGSRFGVFEVRGDQHLFGEDFETAKDAFAFLRTRHAPRGIKVSKVHANWLVFIT